MKDKKFRTKEELLEEFNFSRATFYRRLRELGLNGHGCLLSPEEQEAIRKGLMQSTKKPQPR